LSRPKINFEDLKKLATTQEERNSRCGKRAYSVTDATKIAAERSAFSGVEVYAMPCFGDCGWSIFHLTREKPSRRAEEWTSRQLALAKKNQRRSKGQRVKNINGATKKRRRKATALAQICDWENEGGAII
jgi:hypothetical protein